MKTLKFNTKVLLTLTFAGFFISSCSENEPVAPVAQDQEVNEIVQSSQMDQISASLENFIIEVYEDQESAEARGGISSRTSFPECVTLTLVMEQNFRELTIDFDEGGCDIHGHLYRGQIVLTYQRNPQAQQVTLDYVLNDYYFDDIQVLGSNSILKELSNANGNPQFTHNVDLTVIWPNGIQASREGQIVNEWIEGFDTGVFTDNVFEYTGYWNATFANGGTHNYEVILPLRKEASCYHFVRGSIDADLQLFDGVLDYGDGACDNLATFTFANGTLINIVLN
ncbi:hypothetical protein OS188_08470 [Xanthomarina sp. F1114]|uniref:hypothetical protein n=1 Tax=Xanthomarina sp. F1114 TaxID=2996019 RepID=UPI00225DEFE1|nr:hypothetical protein [Xanthomarina sp. F1114]MCX7547986.1 hypothetical protein [Xanthomarina sp. F1114]